MHARWLARGHRRTTRHHCHFASFLILRSAHGPFSPSFLALTHALEHRLRVLDTHQLALLHPLERQSCNQCSANAATVLGWEDLDGIVVLTKRFAVTASLPVQNFLQSLRAASLEVRVL